ncbi:MAG TPA: hypothetical protein VII49_14545 [Rhizomicrobium sp.]
MKRRLVLESFAREGLVEVEIAQTVEVRPASRRRATFKVAKIDGATLLGFHATGSHRIVNMQQCRVLTPEFQRLVPSLRDMMAERLKDGDEAELYVVQTDGGFDVALRGLCRDAVLTAWAARWAQTLHLARITVEDHVLVELAPPTLSFGRATVRLPPMAFIQPTRDGEAVLQSLVLAVTKRARNVADLFAGVGTFALKLAETARVQAIDADGAALNALGAAARATQRLKPVTALKRDLFRRPLGREELEPFDAVVLDPPRAGAAQQARELMRSRVPLIAYVSCNPASFARDAKCLAVGGYRLGVVTPVDQFVWSSHIELVASFSKA